MNTEALGPVLVADEGLAGSDALVTSKVLARALGRENPDLILFGWESVDGNGAMLWAGVAEQLGFPSISRVCELRIDSSGLRARRQMEYGFDLVEGSLPCLVSISGAINSPRYPALKAIVASKRKTVEVLRLVDLTLDRSEVGESGSRTSTTPRLVFFSRITATVRFRKWGFCPVWPSTPTDVPWRGWVLIPLITMATDNWTS